MSTLEAFRSQPLVLEPPANSKLEFFIDTEEFLDVVNEIGEVSETSPCPDATTAEGSGLKLVRPGQEASFTVTVRDAQGELCGMGGDVFVVEPINEWGEEVEVNLKDNGDGTYLATYTVPNNAVGDYKLFVLLRGAHIKESPCTCNSCTSRLDNLPQMWSAKKWVHEIL